jgi:hypothetical protein
MMSAGGNLRFPPTGPPSAAWLFVASEHGQSPHSRQRAAQLEVQQ